MPASRSARNAISWSRTVPVQPVCGRLGGIKRGRPTFCSMQPIIREARGVAAHQRAHIYPVAWDATSIKSLYKYSYIHVKSVLGMVGPVIM